MAMLAMVFVVLVAANQMLGEPSSRAAVESGTDDGGVVVVADRAPAPADVSSEQVVGGFDRSDASSVALWTYGQFTSAGVSLDAGAGAAVFELVGTDEDAARMANVNRAAVEALVAGLPPGAAVSGDALEISTQITGTDAQVRIWGRWTVQVGRRELRSAYLTHRYVLVDDGGWKIRRYDTSSGPDPVADAGAIDALLAGFEPVAVGK